MVRTAPPTSVLLALAIAAAVYSSPLLAQAPATPVAPPAVGSAPAAQGQDQKPVEPKPVDKLQLPIPTDLEAERQGGVRDLTLEDALRLGRIHNPRLKAAALLPERASFDIVAAEASFDPELYASANYGESESPARNQFSPSLSRTSMDAAVGWRQRAVTGALFDLAFRPARFETSGSTAFPDRQFTAEWSASVRQPLLRGGWADYNRAPVDAAQFGFVQARSEFARTVQTTLLDIVVGYWELVFARQNYRVVASALAVAREQLRITDVRIAVRELVERDRIADLAEVARRQEELIAAENSIRRGEDALRSLLYDGSDASMWRINLRPSTAIEFDASQPLPDLEPCLDRALAERPELRAQRAAIAAAQVALRETESDALPGLDLIAAFSSDGVRDSFHPAFADASELEYPDWSIGLEFTLPLGNRARKARRTQARLEVERQQRELQALILQVTTEVRDAVRNLGSLRQSVAASAESERLAASNLETEQAKLRVGASTNFEVQRRLQELSEAQQRHLRNLLNHRIAESRLVYVQGLLQAPQDAGSGDVGSGDAGSQPR